MCLSATNWKITLTILCCYGFTKEIRPIEPFLTPYLMADKNFTDNELNAEVYPYWTYSYLIVLIPVFLLTDLLRYKIVIAFEGLAYLSTWLLLTFGSTIFEMQAMQCFYGFATATEVAYYSYIYSVVDVEHYQKATSYVRGAVLVGRCVAYSLSQIVISLKPGQYVLLNYISLAAMALICIIAVLLPSSNSHRKKWYSLKKVSPEPSRTEDQAAEEISVIGLPEVNRSVSSIKAVLMSIVENYSNGFVLKWSIWWAFATCGFFQTGNYIQTMWAAIYSEAGSPNLYNGLTEAINTFLGAMAALSVQYLRVNWSVWGEAVLGVISLVNAAALIIISRTNQLAVAYVFYCVFCVLYQFVITIATMNIASSIRQSSYALVIGCNTFIALVLQTILTLVVNDRHGFGLDSRSQFLVYGCYFGVICIAFLAMGVEPLLRRNRDVDTN